MEFGSKPYNEEKARACSHPTLLPITATCAECGMSAHQIIALLKRRIEHLEAVNKLSSSQTPQSEY